ncbi:MAG: undecaprenyldiphospho-muramoylpentapeptide beta-N-acetylglucosaminyltransferase, partial [bacterium]
SCSICADPFRVIKGIRDAKNHLKELRPDIIFSKGGFVSVPVVRAAHSLKIPVIAHESDMTPGLANRLCLPMADAICCNFPETLEKLPKGKAVLTGTPIRAELLIGSREKGLSFTGFSGKKPVVMVIGGSLGAVAVNRAVREALPELLTTFDIVHLCGKGKIDEGLVGRPGYKQYEYISEELPDLFALADVVVSRAGANAICEIAALRKPNILIPLPSESSRGDQILNAMSFESRGFSVVFQEDSLTTKKLIDTLRNLAANPEPYVKAMEESPQGDAIRIITELIEEKVSEK